MRGANRDPLRVVGGPVDGCEPGKSGVSADSVARRGPGDYLAIEGHERPFRHRHPRTGNRERDEVHEPQEGRTVPSEPFRSPPVESSKGRQRQGVPVFGRCQPDPRQVQGRPPPRERRAPEEKENPWRGESPREDRALPVASRRNATDFHGGQSPEGGRGIGGNAGTARADARRAGRTGRSNGRAVEGEPFEGQNPRSATVLKHVRTVAGGTRRQEGAKPWRRSRTRGRQPRERSLPATSSAVGKETLERRRSASAGRHSRSVILRRGAEVHEGSAASHTEAVAASDRKTPGGPKGPGSGGASNP